MKVCYSAVNLQNMHTVLEDDLRDFKENYILALLTDIRTYTLGSDSTPIALILGYP